MPQILPSTAVRVAPGPLSNRNGLHAAASRPYSQAEDGHDTPVALTDASQPERARLGNIKTDPRTARAEADKVLLRACLSGGDAAFAELYRQLAPPLFSMVFAILKDQKNAEDVLQESFVQMWKRAATYDAARGNVFTWSVMITRHKAIDRLRARQRCFKLSEAAAAEAEAVPCISTAAPDDLVSQRNEGERVRAALSRISPVQVDAIKLAFFGGLTQTEIAEKLGARLGTVKARVRRGLLALRAELVTAREMTS